MSPQQRRRRMQRLGISLLEILMSIGVTSIGLLGVASLIPLAQFKAAEGIRQDRQAAVGRRAFREFRIRGMADPRNWITHPQQITNFSTGFIDPNLGSAAGIIRQPYCIDPRTISVQTIGGSFTGNEPYTFPAINGITTNIARIPRLGLKSQPESVLGIVPGIVTASSLAQADRICVIQDDLVFELPDDQSLSPIQTFLGNNTRYAEGLYSWMATLVPMHATPDLLPVPPVVNPTAGGDEYRLSIVVFHKRPLDNLTKQPDTTTERISVVEFLSGGFGGGDVRLSLQSPPYADPNEGLEIRRGEWLMLGQEFSATFLSNSGPINSTVREFKWYQVIAVDEADGEKIREFTLIGPDWHWRPGVSVHATYVPGIVAVFEKTIRLEGPSAWSVF